MKLQLYFVTTHVNALLQNTCMKKYLLERFALITKKFDFGLMSFFPKTPYSNDRGHKSK
jgi:hypothetical protein